MKIFRVFGSCFFPCVLVVACLGISPAAKPQACTGPGKERWPIKTGIPASTDLNKAKQVGLKDLLALSAPPGVSHNDERYESALIPPFPNSLNVKEGELIVTTGWLYLVATQDDDCDYHIQISPQSRTTTSKPVAGDNSLIVEAPRPDFVPDAHLQEVVTSVRNYIRTKLLHSKEPATGGNVMAHPICVSVTGQLFFDDGHEEKNGGAEERGKRGMSSSTLWELHPITAFQVVPASSCQF